MDTTPPTRRAGTLALLAAGALLLSGVALALFFGGAGAVFGPINDILVGLAMALLVPAILALSGPAAPPWFRYLGWATIGAVVILVVGQVLLVAGVIPLPASFLTVSIGLFTFLAWVVVAAVLSLRGELLSTGFGRWGLSAATALVLAATGWFVLPIGVWSVLGSLLLVTLLGTLVQLGRDLRRGSPAPVR